MSNKPIKASEVSDIAKTLKDDVEIKPVTITELDCRPPLGSLYGMVPATQPFWVFGYGSLMWRTGFPYSKKARVKLLGYHRALCIESVHHRGNKETPGLVFGLDEGGMCEGLAFLVEPNDRMEVLDYLYERELISYCYLPMRLPMQFEDGELCYALSFVANQQDKQYVKPLPMEELVPTINNAVGESGANRDYVCNTWTHLQEIGIADCWLEGIVKEIEKT